MGRYGQGGSCPFLAVDQSCGYKTMGPLCFPWPLTLKLAPGPGEQQRGIDSNWGNTGVIKSPDLPDGWDVKQKLEASVSGC